MYSFASTLLFTIAVLSLGSCKNPTYNAKSEAIPLIKKVLDDQVNAWNTGDIDGFMAGYWDSPELRFTSPGGTRYGYDSLRNSYFRSFPKREAMGRLQFDIDTFYTTDYPFIKVRGKWHIFRQDSIGGHFILSFREIHKNEWKIIEDNTW